MSNIHSDKVSFFPSRIIRQGTNKSHRLTDTALKTWIQSLIDVPKKMFVVSYDSSKDGGELVCYFDGVVVTITDLTNYLNSTTDPELYVTAHFDSMGLWGEDDNKTTSHFEFTGIELSGAKITVGKPITSGSSAKTTVYSLHALTKVGGSWEVPIESRYKFTSFSIINIDGGEV